MKGPDSALVILTHTLARASFLSFQFGVYIVVQTARPQVKRTKVSSVLPAQAIGYQERILSLLRGAGTADPSAEAENSRATLIPGSGF